MVIRVIDRGNLMSNHSPYSGGIGVYSETPLRMRLVAGFSFDTVF